VLFGSGQLTATDSVRTATLTWSALNKATGSYGTLAVTQTGAWTYTLNNSLASVQALAAGQTVTDTITVSPSQCPISVLASTSGGRSLMWRLPTSLPLVTGLPRRLRPILLMWRMLRHSPSPSNRSRRT